MPLFHWSKSNQVFVPDIDHEHEAIFGIAIELQKSIEKNAPLFETHEALHRLIAALEDHLTHEERLMRQGHYESYAWHKQQHDTIRSRMKEYAPRVEQGDVTAGKTLIAVLSKWLHDHLVVTDRMMGAFLRNQQRAG